MLPSLDRALQKLQEIHREEESYLRSRYIDYMNVRNNSFQGSDDERGNKSVMLMQHQL